MNRLVIAFSMLSLLSCRLINHREPIIFPAGGFPFESDLAPGDSNSYIHPLRNVISKSDSVEAAFNDPNFYTAFDEPNLSLHPPEKPIVRLVYNGGFGNYHAIVRLEEGRIIVKEKVKGYPYPELNMQKLSEVESFQLSVLNQGYLDQKYDGNASRKRIIDSLVQLYPAPYSTTYHLTLLKKSKVEQMEEFRYRSWTRPISFKLYRRLVTAINQSDFWHLDYRDNRCAAALPMDGDEFSLEVATPEKYQKIVSPCCPNPSLIESACNQLMEEASVTASRDNYYRNVLKKHLLRQKSR